MKKKFNTTDHTKCDYRVKHHLNSVILADSTNSSVHNSVPIRNCILINNNKIRIAQHAIGKAPWFLMKKNDKCNQNQDESDQESNHSSLNLTDYSDDDNEYETNESYDEEKEAEVTDESLLDDHVQIYKYARGKRSCKKYYGHLIINQCWLVPFTHGQFRSVYHACYSALAKKDGKKVGQRAVIKKWKKRNVFSKWFWYRDQRVCQISQKLIDKWNQYEKVNLKKSFKILKPEPVIFVGETKGLVTTLKYMEWCLIEDYLPGEFIKWNSNSGWTSNEKSCMQAFCHWTYHYSNGKILFCDAQGIITKKEYILTDPCILSIKGGIYGAADCGFDFILNWFKYHKCNKYCQKHWITPHGQIKQNIDITKHTTWTWSTEEFKKIKEKEKRELCKCGTMMVCKLASVVNPDTRQVICDECQAKATGFTGVFHCPDGKNTKHPNGYNICGACHESRA